MSEAVLEAGVWWRLHTVVSVGGFGCGASLHRFVEMMGEGKLWPTVGCFRAICLAPQLVCGCSTRAPLAFFLAWGGWRQRSVWRHCVSGQTRGFTVCRAVCG